MQMLNKPVLWNVKPKVFKTLSKWKRHLFTSPSCLKNLSQGVEAVVELVDFNELLLLYRTLGRIILGEI